MTAFMGKFIPPSNVTLLLSMLIWKHVIDTYHCQISVRFIDSTIYYLLFNSENSKIVTDIPLSITTDLLVSASTIIDICTVNFGVKAIKSHISRVNVM